jgi:hypothetical protein
MDGSTPVSASLCVYEDKEEFVPSTVWLGKESLHDLHDWKPDRIGKRADIKPRRGGKVSDLIKSFEKPTRVYDPGADRKISPLQAMSSIRGGGENGGSAKDPTRPKPLSGDELAVAEADRQLALVTSEAAGDSNWDGVAADVRNTGPEGLLEGDIDLEDEFCMEEEAEEVVVPERPKVWKMLARYYSLSAANYSVIQKHFHEVWRIRSKMIFTPLKNNFFIIMFTSEGDFNFVDRVVHGYTKVWHA